MRLTTQFVPAMTVDHAISLLGLANIFVLCACTGLCEGKGHTRVLVVGVLAMVVVAVLVLVDHHCYDHRQWRLIEVAALQLCKSSQLKTPAFGYRCQQCNPVRPGGRRSCVHCSC